MFFLSKTSRKMSRRGSGSHGGYGGYGGYGLGGALLGTTALLGTAALIGAATRNDGGDTTYVYNNYTQPQPVYNMNQTYIVTMPDGTERVYQSPTPLSARDLLSIFGYNASSSSLIMVPINGSIHTILPNTLVKVNQGDRFYIVSNN